MRGDAESLPTGVLDTASVPDEVQRVIDNHLRGRTREERLFDRLCPCFYRMSIRRMIRDLKIQHTYGGHDIAYRDRPDGKREILAVDDGIEQFVGRQDVIFSYGVPDWEEPEIGGAMFDFDDEGTPDL